MPNKDIPVKKSIDVSFLAKLIISIAIVLMIYGLYLDVSSNKILANSNNDSQEENKNSILIDIYHIGDNSNDTKDNSNFIEGRKTDGEDSSPTISDINNDLRNQIQDNYSITIKYGKETEGYSIGGMNTIPITDENKVFDNLTKLNNAMSLYPDGFFQEINAGGIPLTIYLIEKYSIDGVTGVTDSTNRYANISIATAYSFDDSFHHENYHYIERYLYKKGIYYRVWSGYNPAGFVYVADGGPLQNNMSYSHTKAADAYFVNDYAQTSAEEDRASTFEYMMKSEKYSCFNEGSPLWNKAITMSNSIDVAIKSVTPDTVEYWERNL